MKKSVTKQLLLKRDTIRLLAAKSLTVVAGGGSDTFDPYNSGCYPTLQARPNDR